MHSASRFPTVTCVDQKTDRHTDILSTGDRRLRETECRPWLPYRQKQPVKPLDRAILIPLSKNVRTKRRVVGAGHSKTLTLRRPYPSLTADTHTRSKGLLSSNALAKRGTVTCAKRPYMNPRFTRWIALPSFRCRPEQPWTPPKTALFSNSPPLWLST